MHLEIITIVIENYDNSNFHFKMTDKVLNKLCKNRSLFR